ncbi:hypothetical protein DWV07_12050 [Dickeya zeae]|nr:hypothetical protein DWV07_12050 [Dickeya zeae]
MTDYLNDSSNSGGKTCSGGPSASLFMKHVIHEACYLQSLLSLKNGFMLRAHQMLSDVYHP